ncbi:MAG TPA: class I SAM-dependent methyltransferase [Victivallales bacterium]|nr:class I SAM-dependent methyltransferase [Victivallales bacterium]
MDTVKLFDHLEKPVFSERGNSSMWEDEYISKQLLDMHLSPDMDAASRRPSVINKTVDWMVENYLKQGDKILDLGCGPGLYASRLAEKGFNVTGLDFSENSINYAKNYALSENLSVNYICDSYLNLKFENEFDVIILIYCDLGALTELEREKVLNNINKALKPGGIFIFDYFAEATDELKKENTSWELCDKNSFWSKNKHLLLTRNLYYTKEKANLIQYIVIEEDVPIKDYRFYNYYFSEDTIKPIFKKNGFDNFEFTGDIVNEDNWCHDIDVIFVKASKV